MDALGTGHVGVGAGGPEAAAPLGAAQPVEKQHQHGGEEQQQGQGVGEVQRTYEALGQQQGVFVHAHSLVGLAAHDTQVDGVQGQLGENTGQNGGDAAAGVELAGDEAGHGAAQRRAQQRQPGVDAAANQHDAHGAAGGQGTVHRQVRHVQHPEGEVDADGHQAPHQALGDGAGHCIEQRYDHGFLHRSARPRRCARGGALIIIGARLPYSAAS